MVPTDLGGPQGQHLSDPWIPGHVVFVCVKDRAENFQTFFGTFGEPKTTHVGVRPTQEIV
jgi:hypothetical protein